MTYKQLIDHDFLSETPTFNELQMHLVQLAQSVPEKELELSLSIGPNSIYVFVYAIQDEVVRQQGLIEFYKWDSHCQWADSLGVIRHKCMNPLPVELSEMDKVVAELRSERLETIRLRNLIKLSGGVI
jgi:hypothetical protein